MTFFIFTKADRHQNNNPKMKCLKFFQDRERILVAGNSATFPQYFFFLFVCLQNIINKELEFIKKKKKQIEK